MNDSRKIGQPTFEGVEVEWVMTDQTGVPDGFKKCLMKDETIKNVPLERFEAENR